MKAKLIKVNDNQLDGGFYILRDLNGNPIELEGNLSLNNCEAIERGYDLNELISESNTSHLALFTSDSHELMYDEGFKAGFQKCLELLGDKKFSEEDMIKCMKDSYGLKYFSEQKMVDNLKSLQQNEWDVEILMEKDEPKSFVKRKVIRKLDNGEEIKWTCFWDNGWFDSGGVAIPNVISWERLPILDKDDCLILKLIK